MKEPAPISPVINTRQRLIEGASRIFARDVIAGSTTREIAREAGVNEVTLFRHFQCKDRLIEAVIGENFGTQAVLDQLPAPVPSADLRQDLTEYAQRYERLLKENLPLIRTMIGEIHHHGDQERQVFKAIFRPLREALVARLQMTQSEGRQRAAAAAEILADLFTGMIFMGVLRRNSSHLKLEYSAGSYLTTAVELIVRSAGNGI
jgi:AcrR family transcriptional regulator